MNRLINLELIKIFKKGSIKVLFIIVFALCLLSIYFTNKKENFVINNFNLVENTNEKWQKYNDKVNDYAKIYNYYKENNIDMNLKIKGVIDTGVTIIIFLSIVVVLISSTVLSDEINRKSIKELLTKPYKRWKIITSKIISVFIIIFILSIFVYSSYILLSSIICGVNVFNIKEVIISGEKIVESYYYLTFLKEVLLNSIPLYFICLLTIFLSVVINNSKVISAIMITATLMSTLVFQFLLSIDVTLVQYTFFPYLDLSIYKDIYNICLLNTSYNINLNTSNGILLLSAYCLIFYILSVLLFNKKDIL